LETWVLTRRVLANIGDTQGGREDIEEEFEKWDEYEGL